MRLATMGIVRHGRVPDAKSRPSRAAVAAVGLAAFASPGRRVVASVAAPRADVPCGRVPSAQLLRRDAQVLPVVRLPRSARSPPAPTIRSSAARLPGGYVILELVGIGGMGRVYRAEQTNLGRTVAVKIIHPHLVGEENAAARFITEARAASRLNHPNSVGVIDFGKTPDGQLYLVMEFLRGRDLARVTYEDGPLPFRRIVDVLRQTLAALAEAHNVEHHPPRPQAREHHPRAGARRAATS